MNPITIHWDTLDLEDKYDWVEVYDGTEADPSALLGTFTGTILV